MRLNIVLVILFLTWAGIVEAQEISGRLVLTVTGLRSNRGQVVAAVFNSSDGFPNARGKSLARLTAPIVNKQSVLVFENLPYAEYAIGVIHDENSNGTLDFGFLHIPKEGYGASNNARGKFGPPGFDDALFTFAPQNKNITIKINY